MHEVLVNRLGGLSLPRKSVVRLTDRPDMTLDVYRGRKTTIQQYNKYFLCTKGHHSVKSVDGVTVLIICTSSKVLYSYTKFCENIFDGSML